MTDTTDILNTIWTLKPPHRPALGHFRRTDSNPRRGGFPGGGTSGD